jgi:reverse gyrase
MAGPRKKECLDCEHVFLSKGNPVCPECQSSNIAGYAPNYEDPSVEEIDEALDRFELKDFYDRRRNSY